MTGRESERKTRDQERLWAMWTALRQVASTLGGTVDPRASKAWHLAINAMEEDNRRARDSFLANADAAIAKATEYKG